MSRKRWRAYLEFSGAPTSRKPRVTLAGHVDASPGHRRGRRRRDSNSTPHMISRQLSPQDGGA
jgi:hypothetical protein